MTGRGLAVAGLVAASLLGACSGGDATTVKMVTGHHYTPAEITVGPGATIEFVNDSSEAHSATAYEDRIPPGAGYFSSGGFGGEQEARANVGDGLIAPGGSYEVTLDEPGTYRYFCIPHEQDGMKGEIVVGSSA
jgi:plastocyanin